MLHITNGDSAKALISKADLGGDVLSWDDVLHEGAVRGGLTLDELSEERAEFIASCGWGKLEDVRAEFRRRDERLKRSGEESEVVLWFEHDLYDQLQLIQLLDWFAQADSTDTKLSLICINEYKDIADFQGLGQLNTDQMRELFPTRRIATPEQLSLARRAWAAFGADDPRAIERSLAEDMNALPFLHAALRRHLQQFPSSLNGLSRTEANMLHTLDARGACDMPSLFENSQAREEAQFLGDWCFMKMYLEPLCHCAVPLVSVKSGNIEKEFQGGTASENAISFSDRFEMFFNSEFEITNAGRDAMRGEADHVELNGIDCWRGGVHLHNGNIWRWNETDEALIAAVSR